MFLIYGFAPTFWHEIKTRNFKKWNRQTNGQTNKPGRERGAPMSLCLTICLSVYLSARVCMLEYAVHKAQRRSLLISTWNLHFYRLCRQQRERDASWGPDSISMQAVRSLSLSLSLTLSTPFVACGAFYVLTMRTQQVQEMSAKQEQNKQTMGVPVKKLLLSIMKCTNVFRSACRSKLSTSNGLTKMIKR